MLTRVVFLAALAGALVAGCSTTVPNVRTSPQALADEAWRDCRDIMIVLPVSEPAKCPNRLHFAPGEPVGYSTDGRMAGYFCICEWDGNPPR